MNYATTPTLHHNRNQQPHLTEAQRQELLALIAANPTATCPQIAELFSVRTGRALSKVAVRRAWVHGYRSGKEVVR